MIDFQTKQLTYRRLHASLKNELLARAMGLKKSAPARIVDACAGLAQDSFIIASLGFEITLIERSPIICAAIKEAMSAAMQDPSLTAVIDRMHLIHADAIQYLPTLKPDECPDIIYLDPMFPESKKSALNKLAMRKLHEIVGEDLDSDQLLQAALACAKKRVVVKRPRLAKPLAGLEPNYRLPGRANRFDIYQTGT